MHVFARIEISKVHVFKLNTCKSGLHIFRKVAHLSHGELSLSRALKLSCYSDDICLICPYISLTIRKRCYIYCKYIELPPSIHTLPLVLTSRHTIINV